MVPDSVESRVNRLEREVSALEQRVKDLGGDVRELIPVHVAMARLESCVGTIQREVAGIKESISARDDAVVQERRSLRIALIGLTGVILAALIAAAATLIASGAVN